MSGTNAVINSQNVAYQSFVEICSLPKDILLEVFKRLNIKDLFSCSSTCRTWSASARDDSLWRVLFHRDCHISAETHYLSAYRNWLETVPSNLSRGSFASTMLTFDRNTFGQTNRIFLEGDQLIKCDLGLGKTVSIWNAITGELEHTIADHTDLIQHCFVDKGRLFTKSKDNTIRIYDLKTMQCTHVLEGKGDKFIINQNLFVACDLNSIKVWDLENNWDKTIETTRSSTACVSVIGTKLVWCCREGEKKRSIKIFDLHTDQTLTIACKPLESDYGHVPFAIIDEKRMAIQEEDLITIWNLDTAHLLDTFRDTNFGSLRIGSTDKITIEEIYFAEGKLVSRCFRGDCLNNKRRIFVIDMETKRFFDVLQEGDKNQAFYIGEGRLVASYDSRSFRIWDLKTLCPIPFNEEPSCGAIFHFQIQRGILLVLELEHRAAHLYDLNTKMRLIVLDLLTKKKSLAVFSEGKLACEHSSLYSIEILDFTASNTKILNQIADQREHPPQNYHTDARERFRRLPDRVKNSIGSQLTLIFDTAKNVPAQEVQAIRNYLSSDPSTLPLSVHCDAGHRASLFLCGSGGGVSWDPAEAKPLTRQHGNIWKIKLLTDVKEYKIIWKKGDHVRWEKGSNHVVESLQPITLEKVHFEHHKKGEI